MGFRIRLLTISFLFISFTTFAKKKQVSDTDQYVAALKNVTDVMLIDVASPVAASRYYAYLTIASYECVSVYNKNSYPSLSGYLNAFESSTVDPNLLNGTDAKLAYILAVYKTGQKLMPSGYLLNQQVAALKKKYCIDKLHHLKFNQTSNLVDTIVSHLFDYAKKDKFNQLNNLPRYIFKEGDGYWKQTPPAFMLPIEPHWNTLRTFLLDSAQQFKPSPPVSFDTVKGTEFYQLVKEVYDFSLQSNPQQMNAALFWDCNPFAVQQLGHIEFGIKKISPGGHWIGITGIACKQAGLSIEKTILTHCMVSVSMADAFIACWDEKYRSNRVRPETVIQNLFQRNWKPLLQTPPFPEYVSGHSVVSATAATLLTQIFGTHFKYLDDTEVEFGLPARNFDSFNDAATEASLSRLYGGIHFRDAIEQGNKLGTKISNHVITKLAPFIALLK